MIEVAGVGHVALHGDEIARGKGQGVEVVNQRPPRVDDDAFAVAPGEAGDVRRWGGRGQLRQRLLAFAHDEEIKRRELAQCALGQGRRVKTAEHRRRRRPLLLDSRGDLTRAEISLEVGQQASVGGEM